MPDQWQVAATRLGMTREEYAARQLAGEKWCWRCVDWHSVDDFPLCKGRRDGYGDACRMSHNEYRAMRRRQGKVY